MRYHWFSTEAEAKAFLASISATRVGYVVGRTMGEWQVRTWSNYVL